MLVARCPHCRTRFRVQREQLRAADGWVRCGSCGQPFDALEGLDQGPTPAAPPLGRSAPQPAPAAATSTAESSGFEIPPQLADLEPEAFATAPQAPACGPWPNLAWGLASLVLLFCLLLQLAWFERERLVYQPLGHAFLQGLCDLVGCKLPARRDLEQLRILSRDVRSEPGQPPQLALRLRFTNLAPFPQPYPRIQLSLFSASGELSAQGIFGPEQYLEPPAPELLDSGAETRAALELLDPAPPVQGFRIDFL